MNTNHPAVRLCASIRTSAARAAVYATLADISTHLTWGGEGTRDEKFRLLTLDQPGGAAVTGTRFTSTGVVPFGTFHDETVVTDAAPGHLFAFVTASVLERTRGDAWRGSFEHRYALSSDGEDTVIRYECDIFAGNYMPYWWRLPMRPMTRYMLGRKVKTSLRSLAAMAEAAAHTTRATAPMSEAAAS
jgi:hypothetical protein